MSKEIPKINKEMFNSLVLEYGLSVAIDKVRSLLGKNYSSLNIRFNDRGDLIIKRMANRTKTKKPISAYRLEVLRKRKEKRLTKRLKYSKMK